MDDNQRRLEMIYRLEVRIAAELKTEMTSVHTVWSRLRAWWRSGWLTRATWTWPSGLKNREIMGEFVHLYGNKLALLLYL
jgi:sugar lactone lactonase YvrE